MASFASVFGYTEQEHVYSNNIGSGMLDSNRNGNQLSNNFSNIDLDQQPISSKEHLSSYTNFSETPTFQNELLSTNDDIPRSLSHNSSLGSREIPSNKTFASSNTASNKFSTSSPEDRRTSIPDLSKLSATSAAAVAAVGPTIDKLKQWSRSTYKCTKQSLYEKLGKTTRTVDIEVDAQIERLREIKHRYENMLALARSYTNHFYNLIQTQRGLSDQFFELKQKSPHLSDEFGYNAETQRLLVQNGETLLAALNYFVSTLNTLCSKTIEDTMTTIRLYEMARLQYDACRTEIELLSAGVQVNEKQHELEKYREKYEQLKSSVIIKLKLLDDNQTKVLKHQLLLFHNAIAAYFSGNKQALDGTMKQFNIKVLSNENNLENKQSFLEQSHS